MNPLIQTLCRSQSFWTKKDRLGIVVIDEIHLVGDGARGFLLELICTKLLLAATDLSANPSPKMSPKSPSSIKPATRTQIVGMSATVPNLEQMGQWLNAIVYRLDFWNHVTSCLRGLIAICYRPGYFGFVHLLSWYVQAVDIKLKLFLHGLINDQFKIESKRKAKYKNNDQKVCN